MPTGYTAKVCEQEVSFEEFVLTCARAFGALIMMRDNSLDTPIPEKFEPSDYHVKAYAAAVDEFARLSAMSPEEIRAFGEEKRKVGIDYNREQRLKDIATRDRLNVKLAQVAAWNPPTKDHVELKNFMVQQLNETLKYDGNYSYHDEQIATLTAKPNAEFHAEAVERAKRDIKYHQEELTKEEQRAEDRTRWVRDLRESLKQTVAA